MSRFDYILDLKDKLNVMLNAAIRQKPKLDVEFFKSLKLEPVKFQAIQKNVSLLFMVSSGAYILSAFISAVVMTMMVKTIIKGKTRSVAMSENSDHFSMPTVKANFRDLKKVIIERNIFSSDGKVPEEKEILANMSKTGSGFSLDAPCQKPTLNVELLGTIYLGDPKISFATVKEKGYDEADIYRVGDQIVGTEGAFIASVERQKLIVNNNGTKECFDLAKGEEALNNSGSFPVTPGGFSDGGASSSDVTVDSAYVESELGPGFGKIIDAARLVPNTVDNAVNGFKIFAIKPDSLLTKIGLQNGDVITQVNNTSLTLPEQGFALFQSLQDEKEIRVQVLRGGTTPTTLNVRIKSGN